MSRRVTERIKAREAKTFGRAAVEEVVGKLAQLPPDQIVEPMPLQNTRIPKTKKPKKVE